MMSRMVGVLALVCCAAIAVGQGITLDGPDSPIQPREYCQIQVGGLSDADLAAASIEWAPRDGTTLIAARAWGGQPFLLFVAAKPGKYAIAVQINAWRTNLDAAVDSARRAAIDAELLGRLTSLQKELLAKYPARAGSCEIQVGEPGPNENPFPQPAAELAAAVKPVAAIKTSRQDGTALANLYDQASRLVTSAAAAIAAGTRPDVATTGDLRAWLVSHGKELGLAGRYAGLADAIETLLRAQLGREARDLVAEDASVFAALAWACWESGR